MMGPTRILQQNQDLWVGTRCLLKKVLSGWVRKQNARRSHLVGGVMGFFGGWVKHPPARRKVGGAPKLQNQITNKTTINVNFDDVHTRKKKEGK